MFSIGEFSKITGLTVKTLRFYHEEGLLMPSYIDEHSGYRYYAENKIEIACVITQLRKLEFSLIDIAEILNCHDDDSDILDHLRRQLRVIEDKTKQYQQISVSLVEIINKEREAQSAMQNATYEVEEKTVEPMLIAGVRMKAKYNECGKGFAKIGKRFGRHLCGKPLLLHYDTEYKENDADFEACMPIHKGTSSDDISVRDLEGGKCVSLLHKGPYQELGRSYAKIIEYIKKAGYEIIIPSREVYIKGPGMILKGNPSKYLTEIQMLIKQ